jgi:hydrogenase maturation protease
MKRLILGMGSPVLSDDGVGLVVAGQLEGRFPEMDVVTTAMAGFNNLDLLEGYDQVFLIDAITTRGGTVGKLEKRSTEQGTLHLFSSHGINFFELLTFGANMGLQMPAVSAVYGIEIGDRVEFGEGLTPTLKQKLDHLIEEIAADIGTHLIRSDQR